MEVVYIDGVFDLFHRGHLESLKKAKYFKDTESYLIVGVVSDEDAENYKRKPIISFEDRCEIIGSIGIVNQVVEKCPLILDNDFLNKYNITRVVHGFSNENDWLKQKVFFEDIIDKFSIIQYYDKISTTDIINKIKHNY
jgi:choline-phosphate cytidylyltransferase